MRGRAAYWMQGNLTVVNHSMSRGVIGRADHEDVRSVASQSVWASGPSDALPVTTGTSSCRNHRGMIMREKLSKMFVILLAGIALLLNGLVTSAQAEPVSVTLVAGEESTVLCTTAAGCAVPIAFITASMFEKNINANTRGMARESSVLNKGIRLFGPSVRDIKAHRVLGGNNSEPRRVVRAAKRIFHV